ncbi:hypothetical protein [Paracraurococcus ruber]|uniref:hypothetical protein n=1 Tax=Paracraurococcus ruber TaxID=77675 RepID=UPI001057D9F8|nr:hypothetical protein [Paracraurococcus ruber]TDG30604.1 hypothetical protein E2C05_13815 [Paracraurococcus ruber]
MVALPFDFDAYDFQNGFLVLRGGITAALGGIESNNNALKMKLTEYEEGGLFEGQEDEDGCVIWSLDQLLQHKIENNMLASEELRRGFVITAFHLWERSIQHLNRKASRNANDAGCESGGKHLQSFGDFEKALKRLHFPMHANLRPVYLLATFLKHDNERHWVELSPFLDKLFPTITFEGSISKVDAASLRITDDHLNMIFDVLSRSGPQETPAGITDVAL